MKCPNSLMISFFTLTLLSGCLGIKTQNGAGINPQVAGNNGTVQNNSPGGSSGTGNGSTQGTPGTGTTAFTCSQFGAGNIDGEQWWTTGLFFVRNEFIVFDNFLDDSTSPDGTTWAGTWLNLDGAGLEGQSISFGGDARFLILDGYGSGKLFYETAQPLVFASFTLPSGVSNWAYALAAEGNSTIVVQSPTSGIYYSPTTSPNWSQVAQPPGVASQLLFNASTNLFLGVFPHGIYTSSNGGSWSLLAAPPSGDSLGQLFLVNGNTYVMMTDSQSNPDLYLLSPAGAFNALNLGNTIVGLVGIGQYGLYAVGSAGEGIWSHNGGANWEIGELTGNAFVNLAYGNNALVAVANVKVGSGQLVETYTATCKLQ